MTQPDPEFTECYSDHAHDIATRLICDICGSTEVDVVGHVLPGIERLHNVDPLTAAKRVMHEKSAKFVDGVLLDHYTASAIVAVGKALSPAAEAKLRSMTLTKAAAVCWKLVSK